VMAVRARRYIARVIEHYKNISTVPRRNYVRYQGERLRIDSLLLDDSLIGANYRFKTREQLSRLYVCYRIPAFFVIPEAGYRFNGQELLLISLERCALGSRYLDLQQKYHVQHSVICRGINFFAKWMNENWGYLLRDNLDFWKDYLEGSMLAIKRKMSTQYGFNYDEHFEDEFKFALFIDCTMLKSDRPGGGPMRPGVQAPRYPYLIQEAYYNGWKGIHGIKKQSIGMANGMAFHVSKGYSCRRNDLHILNETDMDDRLVALTIENHVDDQFRCYGDSAYPETQRISCRKEGVEFTDLNKAMNGCRESIEWMYRDLNEHWKIIGRKYCFKLLTGFVAADNLIDLCFTLSNAWNCLNHNECSQWFECPPPTLETYTLQGPRPEANDDSDDDED
jgi:DDE superfamily endonuclease